MPRPVKVRKVGFIPKYKLFTPVGLSENDEHTILLKYEELEAMRLKDIENLHQEACAEIMDVSRQTFQLIIDQARSKVTTALIHGRTLKIEGGNYIKTECKKRCKDCGNIFVDKNLSHQNCMNKRKIHCGNCCKS